MTPMGWLFLLTSLTVVWGLALWCYYKVLSVREDPPDPVKHFHSA
jgi:hypothetical protein